MEVERTFVNWRLIFTALALIANTYPKTKDLKAYFLKLEAVVDPESGLIVEDKFINVSIKNVKY